METFLETFRTNVKFYRENKQLSQRELAIQTDVTDGSIGMIESGKSKPSFDMIIKLANALSVHPADLFLRDASKTQGNIENTLSEICFQELPKIIEKKFSVSLKSKQIE